MIYLGSRQKLRQVQLPTTESSLTSGRDKFLLLHLLKMCVYKLKKNKKKTEKNSAGLPFENSLKPGVEPESCQFDLTYKHRFFKTKISLERKFFKQHQKYPSKIQNFLGKIPPQKKGKWLVCKLILQHKFSRIAHKENMF